jgi:hypothetical protein
MRTQKEKLIQENDSLKESHEKDKLEIQKRDETIEY